MRGIRRGKWCGMKTAKKNKTKIAKPKIRKGKGLMPSRPHEDEKKAKNREFCRGKAANLLAKYGNAAKLLE